MPGRDLSGLNPDRKPDVAPPPRQTSPRPAQEPSSGPESTRPSDGAFRSSERQGPSGAGSTRRASPTRHRKPTVHSVPLELVERLKQVARATERTYTDITLECVLNCAANLGQGEDFHLDAFQRRIRQARRERHRTTQLTLYLSHEERDQLEAYVTELGMKRSHVVTQALERGLGDIQ